MKISATVENEEIELNLTKLDVNSNSWVGNINGRNLVEEYLSFYYEDGVIRALSVNPKIQTQDGIILERLMNAFKELTEAQQMGFEAEDLPILNMEGEKPYDPEQIRVRPVFLSAFQVHRDITKGKIDLNPDFQRNFVWNDVQKSLLIESMLLKIPLPAFYFAEDKTGKFQVVDGLQRLTVINQYLNNEFKLKSLQYLKHLEGRYFSIDTEKGIKEKNALYDPYDGRVESTQLNINVIEASSPLEVKYDIFYRINTGGRPLNRQEIRNCFATNKTRILLTNMAKNRNFSIATNFSVKDSRMDAQELALRYCGFSLYLDTYAGDMNGFLDDVLDKLNDYGEEQLDEIQANFDKSLRYSYHLFGSYAFRKCLPDDLLPGSRKQLINKAMFIVWTSLLSKTTDIVLSKPESEFVRILAKELEVNPLLFNSLTTGTTDRYKLGFVFEEFERLLKGYLAA